MKSQTSGVSSGTHSSTQLNHHANQLNPNHPTYQAALDNRANQLNPNHAASKGKV